MKHEWLADLIVAVLCILAGLAIAGLPNSASVDATIVVPETTVAPEPEPIPTTLPPVVTDPPETTAPPTTQPPATTEAPTTTTTVAEPPLPDRSELAVVVANGADIGGIAGDTAAALQVIGYVDVSATDGTEIAPFTVVYFVEGFEPSAVRLAVDLGIDPGAIGPIENAPEVLGTNVDDADLLAYLGIDQG